MVSTGTLALSGSGTLGSTSGALTVNGGTLSLGSTNQTVGAVTLSGGTISSTSGTLTGSSYAVSGGAISASLGGSGAMTVTGSTTLSGNNSSFSGTISINSGTLTAGHANALGTGTTTVNSGATLTIDSGVGLAQTAKIALSNGTLLGAAETSSFAGTLSGSGIISSLTLTSAAVIQWSLNTLSTDANSANKYSLAGALVLDGASVQVAGLSPSSDPFWGSNRSWVVVSSNSQTITGSLLVNNSGWSSLGSFATGTNGSGDVTLNWTAAGAPIPEPSTYAALAGGVALAWVVVRRRRTALPRA